MIDLEVKLKPETLREFNSLINEMVKATGKEQGKVVRNTCRDLARAALRHTGGAKAGKVRVLKVDPAYRTQKSGKVISLPAKMVKPDFRGKGFAVVSKGEPKDERIKVQRGLLKAGWMGCLARLGASVKNVSSSAVKNSNAYKSANWENVAFGNTTPFIEDYNNGKNKTGAPMNILEKAMRDVNATMTKRLNKMANDIMKKGR